MGIDTYFEQAWGIGGGMQRPMTPHALRVRRSYLLVLGAALVGCSHAGAQVRTAQVPPTTSSTTSTVPGYDFSKSPVQLSGVASCRPDGSWQVDWSMRAPVGAEIAQVTQDYAVPFVSWSGFHGGRATGVYSSKMGEVTVTVLAKWPSEGVWPAGAQSGPVSVERPVCGE